MKSQSNKQAAEALRRASGDLPQIRGRAVGTLTQLARLAGRSKQSIDYIFKARGVRVYELPGEITVIDCLDLAQSIGETRPGRKKKTPENSVLAKGRAT